MRRGREIFEVCTKLSKSHKQTFWDYSHRRKRGTRPLYAQLFHAISNKGMQSDEELMDHFEGTRIANNLSYFKHLLLTNLYNSMFPASSHPLSKIQQFVEIIGWLTTNSLVHFAPKYYREGIKLAYFSEEFEECNRLWRLGKLVRWMAGNPTLMLREPPHFKIEEIWRMSEELQSLQRTRIQLVERASNGTQAEAEFDMAYQYDELKSKRAKLEWLAIKRLYASRRGGFGEAFTYLKESIAIFHQNPELTSGPEMSFRYLATLTNLGLYSVRQEDYQTSQEVVAMLRDQADKLPSSPCLARAILVEANLVRKQRRFDMVRKVALEFHQHNTRSRTKIEAEIALSLGNGLMLAGEYGETKKLIGPMLTTSPKVAPPIFLYLFLVQASAMVSLGEYADLPAIIRTIGNFGSRIKVRDGTIAAFSAFLNKVSKEGESLGVYQSFLGEIMKIRKNSPLEGSLNAFMWEEWIKERLNVLR